MDTQFFDSPDNKYTFYYDESGNDRKFYIREDFSGYNVQRKCLHYFLGGVAHHCETEPADAISLIKELKLAKGEELKAAVFGKGAFPEIIGRRITGTFLRWLVDSGLYVHCFHLNLVYWSYVDVIDDCAIYALENKIIPSNGPGFNFEFFLKVHKDALYSVIKQNAEGFFELLSNYGFPELFGKEKKFISDLASLVEKSGLELKEKEPNSQTMLNQLMLAFFLKKCCNIDELTLFSDKANTPIIEDFSLIYQTRAMNFRHSRHIFDQEPHIEKILSDGYKNHPDFTPDIDYSFHDSKENGFELIQVSDAITGILREYYSFIDNRTPAEIIEIRNKLTSRQKENLELFENLLDRTDNNCREMIFSIKTLFESYKNNLFAGRL